MGAPPKLGIIADDLTGACDAGAPFAVAGRRTLVEIGGRLASAHSPEVLGCTTDSRSVDPRQAAEKAEKAAELLLGRGYGRIFKKIDSTLLGNIGVETLAAMNVVGASIAVVAPAFPAMGRRLVGGRLLLGATYEDAGRSISETLFRQTGLICNTISLTDLDAGASQVTDVISALATNGCRFVAVDGHSDNHLDTVASALEQLGSVALPVGSGGLAARMAMYESRENRIGNAAIEKKSSAGSAAHLAPSRGAAVFVGSQNPQTRRQLDFLAQSQSVVELACDAVSGSQVAHAMADGVHVVIQVGWQPSHRRLLDEALQACAAAGVLGVALTGGDTARLVCRLCGCSAIELTGEVAPGLPYGRFVDGLLQQTPVATKAGGFGQDDALLAVLRQFETSEVAHENN